MGRTNIAGGGISPKLLKSAIAKENLKIGDELIIDNEKNAYLSSTSFKSTEFEFRQLTNLYYVYEDKIVTVTYSTTNITIRLYNMLDNILLDTKIIESTDLESSVTIYGIKCSQYESRIIMYINTYSSSTAAYKYLVSVAINNQNRLDITNSIKTITTTTGAVGFKIKKTIKLDSNTFIIYDYESSSTDEPYRITIENNIINRVKINDVGGSIYDGFKEQQFLRVTSSATQLVKFNYSTNQFEVISQTSGTFKGDQIITVNNKKIGFSLSSGNLTIKILNNDNNILTLNSTTVQLDSTSFYSIYQVECIEDIIYLHTSYVYHYVYAFRYDNENNIISLGYIVSRYMRNFFVYNNKIVALCKESEATSPIILKEIKGINNTLTSKDISTVWRGSSTDPGTIFNLNKSILYIPYYDSGDMFYIGILSKDLNKIIKLYKITNSRTPTYSLNFITCINNCLIFTYSSTTSSNPTLCRLKLNDNFTKLMPWGYTSGISISNSDLNNRVKYISC